MGTLRKTKSVKIILEKFDQTDSALSVVDLVEGLKKEMNKTTVYRILERLKENGKLHSFIGKDGRKWYAKSHECSPGKHIDAHPHFQCKQCGKVECLAFDVIIPSLPEYRIDSAKFLLIGECKDCLS